MPVALSPEAQCLVFKFPLRAPGEGELLAKPMQVKEYPNLMQDMARHLRMVGGSENLIRAVKADGHSILIYCTPGATVCLVVHRTKKGGVVFKELELKDYLTSAAFELSAIFKAELVAYYDGVEMGFLEVEPMVKLFEQNMRCNTSGFRLEIRIFGVHSIKVPGEMAERSGLELHGPKYSQVMDALVRKTEDGFVTVIEGVNFRVSLGTDGQLHFYREGKKVATSAQEFFDLCMQEADKSGIEGFVLVSGLLRESKLDTYEILRLGDSVKVKREFKVNLVACRVEEAWSDRTEVWLFGRDKTGLKFVGKTDNERIASYLEGRTCAFEINDPKTKKSLYSQKPTVLTDMPRCFQGLELECTNFSKTHFNVIGLKYKMRKVDYPRFEWLSNTKEVAMASPHFVQTKMASDAFAERIRRGTDNPLIRPGGCKFVPEPTEQKPLKRHNTPPREEELGPKRAKIAEPAPKSAKTEEPLVGIDLDELKISDKDQFSIESSLLWWGAMPYIYVIPEIRYRCPLEKAQIIVTSEAGKTRPKYAVPHFTFEELTKRLQYVDRAELENAWKSCLEEPVVTPVHPPPARNIKYMPRIPGLPPLPLPESCQEPIKAPAKEEPIVVDSPEPVETPVEKAETVRPGQLFFQRRLGMDLLPLPESCQEPIKAVVDSPEPVETPVEKAETVRPGQLFFQRMLGMDLPPL